MGEPPTKETVRPDNRKTLDEVRGEWSDCVKCELGKRRIERDAAFVFGCGVTGGIMFIGEGPGAEEEKEGRPFVGKSGQLLKKILGKLGVTEYYETNIVACRACALQHGADGLPMTRKNYKSGHMELLYKDEPPTPPQYLACRPRLYEEIYLVDPAVIVGLGGKACEALMGRPVTITSDRGEPTHIEIPGASYAPVLTGKSNLWSRRSKGVNRTVIEQNTVAYYFMPTLHPAYVARKLADLGADSPFRQFLADIKKAVRTYEAHREEVFGIVPTYQDDDDPRNDEELHQQELHA